MQRDTYVRTYTSLHTTQHTHTHAHTHAHRPRCGSSTTNAGRALHRERLHIHTYIYALVCICVCMYAAYTVRTYVHGCLTHNTNAPTDLDVNRHTQTRTIKEAAVTKRMFPHALRVHPVIALHVENMGLGPWWT